MNFAFPEEDLMATAADVQGFFITRPGFGLKGGRYIVNRKIGRGSCSSTYLVFDEEKKVYRAAKILTVAATTANEQGILHELECLNIITDKQQYEANLRLLDHFWQRGFHGVHLCFITQVYGIVLHRLMASVPEAKSLPGYVVVQIISWVLLALGEMHSCGIIHGDIKADNVWIEHLTQMRIKEGVVAEPLQTAGNIMIGEENYPILLSQPFNGSFKWDVNPLQSELMDATLGDFGSALLDSQPKPISDIGAVAVRAPENVLGAYEICGKPLDIWAVGCLAYEMLTRKRLFSPAEGDGFTQDEHHLALMLALTKETFAPLIEASSKRDIYFDEQGAFHKAGVIVTPTETIEELLKKHSSLTPRLIEKAASFIRSCIRLNPVDRLTRNELGMHPWMEYANRACADPDNHS